MDRFFFPRSLQKLEKLNKMRFQFFIRRRLKLDFFVEISSIFNVFDVLFDISNDAFALGKLLEVQHVFDVSALICILKVQQHLFSDVLPFCIWILNKSDDKISWF